MGSVHAGVRQNRRCRLLLDLRQENPTPAWPIDISRSRRDQVWAFWGTSNVFQITPLRARRIRALDSARQ